MVYFPLPSFCDKQWLMIICSIYLQYGVMYLYKNIAWNQVDLITMNKLLKGKYWCYSVNDIFWCGSCLHIWFTLLLHDHFESLINLNFRWASRKKEYIFIFKNEKGADLFNKNIHVHDLCYKKSILYKSIPDINIQNSRFD